MRILAVNVPQTDDFSKGGVKSTVGFLGKLANFLKVGGKIIAKSALVYFSTSDA